MITDVDDDRHRILAFLAGRGLDGAGRTAEQVLAFDDARLESVHTYIQWLFPLPEPSRAVPGSPVLNSSEIAAIRADPAACATLDRAAATMLGFYARDRHWLAPRDHNHLRITRILRALRLLRGRASAEEFLRGITALVAANKAAISGESVAFWQSAIET